MAQKQPNNNPLFLLDALYCEEEHWEEEEEEEESEKSMTETPDLHLLEQDLFWEDNDLLSLSSKELETHPNLLPDYLNTDPSLAAGRREAVQWMLRVNAHYSFSPLTAVLSVNYLDRFLASFHFKRDNPWMMQLTAVASLSLAAKVEETHVPLLLDLQVEESRYVFEAKTIQRMELLVLSTLKWKMNPVTPLSFIHHIIRRLGLKTLLHWDFLRSCERLLLSLIPDSRFVSYLPSVFAAATMLHVINQLEPCNPVHYKDQLMDVLNISKEKVEGCFQLILEQSSSGNKRKYPLEPPSPKGVVDSSFSCEDSSNDSWASSSEPSSVLKKSRSENQPQIHPFIKILGNP
ncbi:cyclin-D3-1-like [Tasmannia lanceolata]|uniref:cyclin-D3-1-like n=1 Tax=Tasmannia lanceolata TaxID=3420 RepID=UPI00406342C5